MTKAHCAFPGGLDFAETLVLSRNRTVTEESMQLKTNLNLVMVSETVMYKKINFKQGSCVCQRFFPTIIEDEDAYIYPEKTMGSFRNSFQECSWR
jgi:hypothetical protein